MVESKEQIKQLMNAHREAIANLGVRRVGLFGSFVRGAQNRKSDVDLVVEFQQGKKNFDNFMELSFLLEDILGRKIDLLTPESLSPYIGPRILSSVQFL